LLHQNLAGGPVVETTLDFRYMTSGSSKVYRPIPRSQADEIYGRPVQLRTGRLISLAEMSNLRAGGTLRQTARRAMWRRLAFGHLGQIMIGGVLVHACVFRDSSHSVFVPAANRNELGEAEQTSTHDSH